MKLLYVICFTCIIHGNAIGQNVGIGTNQPNFPLTVYTQTFKGITQKSGSAEVGFYTSSNAAFILTWSNHNLSFGTNGAANQLIVTTAGNVGIGTNTPSARLDINGMVRMRSGSPVVGAAFVATDENGNTRWKATPTEGTKTMFIPFAAFVGASTFMYHETVNGVSRWSPGNIGNTYYRYQAPLLLPVGTVIKEITWHYFDNNNDLNLDFSLVREFFSDASIVSQTSSSGALNNEWQRNVTVNHTLGEYFYWLDISSLSWSADASLRFKGALVTYE